MTTTDIKRTLEQFAKSLPRNLEATRTETLTLDSILSDKVNYVVSPPKAGFTTLVNSLRAEAHKRHDLEPDSNVIIVEGTREEFEHLDDPLWQWARWLWRTFDVEIQKQREVYGELKSLSEEQQSRARFDAAYLAPLAPFAVLQVAGPVISSIASSFSIKVADNRSREQQAVKSAIAKRQLQLIAKKLQVVICIDIHKWKASDKGADDMRSDWENLKRFLRLQNQPVEKKPRLFGATKTILSPIKYLIHDSDLRIDREPKVHHIRPLQDDELTEYFSKLGLDLAQVKEWFAEKSDFKDLVRYSLGYPAYFSNILNKCANNSDDQISRNTFVAAIQEHADEVMLGYKNYYDLFNAGRKPDRGFINPNDFTKYFGGLYYPMVLDRENRDGTQKDGRPNPYSIELSLESKNAPDVPELTRGFLRHGIDLGWFRLSDSKDIVPKNWISQGKTTLPSSGKWVWINPAYKDHLSAVVEEPQTAEVTSVAKSKLASGSDKAHFVQPLFPQIVPGRVRIRTIISQNLGFEFPSWLLDSIKITGVFDAKRAIRDDKTLSRHKAPDVFRWDQVETSLTAPIFTNFLTKHHPLPLVRTDWELVQPNLGELKSRTAKERIWELFEQNPNRFISILHLRRDSVGGIDPGNTIRKEFKKIVTPDPDHNHRAAHQKLWAEAIVDTSSYGLEFRAFIEELKKYITPEDYATLEREGTGMYIYLPSLKES